MVKLVEFVTDDCEGYAHYIVDIMEHHGEIIHFLKKVLQSESSNITDFSTIFRANTICTAAVEYYFRLVGCGYLQNTLGEFVTKVIKEKKQTDVGPQPNECQFLTILGC